MRFSGIITAKLDAKGRAYFPSTFRRQLTAADANLILRRDAYQPCLVVYPQTVWDREVDLLAQRLNRWKPREAMLFRQFLATADVVTLDDDGRLLLPRRRLTEVGITREVAFVGVDDRVELWSAESAEKLTQTGEDYAALMESIMGATAAHSDSDSAAG